MGCIVQLLNLNSQLNLMINCHLLVILFFLGLNDYNIKKSQSFLSPPKNWCIYNTWNSKHLHPNIKAIRFAISSFPSYHDQITIPNTFWIIKTSQGADHNHKQQPTTFLNALIRGQLCHQFRCETKYKNSWRVTASKALKDRSLANLQHPAAAAASRLPMQGEV
jgi:hypothetical protein